MTEEEFWGIIDATRPSASTRPDRLGSLIHLLDAWDLDDLVDFEVWLDRAVHRVDSYHLWGAAYQVCDGLMSEDGFYYFCLWLVGLGRNAFERVAADGDALADLPEIQRLAGRRTSEWADREWPDLQELGSVARKEYERRTGVENSFFAELDRREAKVTYTVEPTDESEVRWRWLKTLKRRSQKAFLRWPEFTRLTDCFFPPIKVLHPMPCHRFDAKTRGRSPVR